MKKVHRIILAIFISVILILFVIRENSFSFSLIRHRLGAFNYDPIVHSFDISNRYEYKVIRTGSSDSDIVLAFLRKNKFGFWKVYDYKENTENSNLVNIKWFTSGGAKSYNHDEKPVFEQEAHIIYYGKNAKKSIQFFPGQLPDNATVNIRQAGDKFMIHIITFSANLDAFNNLDMNNILKNNNCIPAD